MMEEEKEVQTMPADPAPPESPADGMQQIAEILPGPEVVPQTKAGPPPKPEYSPFLQELRALIAVESQDCVTPVKKFLRLGFKGPNLPQRVEEISGVLLEWPHVSELAVELCLPHGPLQKTELMRLLRPHFQCYARNRTAFPASNSDVERRANQLFEWVADGATLSSHASEADKRERLNRVRWMFVCLVAEPHADSQPAIYHLLELHSDCGLDFGARDVAQESLAVMAAYLRGQDKSPAKLVAALRFTAAALHVERHRREAAAASERALNQERAQTALLQRELSEAHHSMSEISTRCALLEQEFASKSAELEIQIRERQLDEEHSKVISHQQLSKVVEEIIRRVSHDLSEAKICLQQEQPNISMAVDRLVRTENWISKRRPT